jgi:tetratricopeptide (TPR) repeat protein
MKLFGSKDQDDNDAEMGAPDDGFDAIDDVADDIEGDGTDTGALAAPVRVSGGGGGGKKGLLLGVGAVVLLGLGGGYYYLTGMQDDAPVPVVVAAHKKAPPQPKPAAPAVKPAVATAAATSVPVPAPVLAPVSVSSAAPTAPAADPLDIPPQGAMPAVPLQPVPTGMPATAPALSAPPAAANAGASAATPVTASAPTSAPGEAAPQDLPVPSNVALAPGAPTGDMPSPDTSAEKNAAAPVWAQPGADVPVSPQEAGARAANALATAKPSDAEMAIVQNAAVLDQLSQPAATTAAAGTATKAEDKTATAKANDKAAAAAAASPSPVAQGDMKTVDQLLQQDAIIRPLPNGYVTILKNHDAGDLDSRLTRARQALSDNNNAAALELFNQLLKSYPKDTRAMMGRAVSLQKMGQVDEALAAYEDVLNAAPKNLEALTNMLGLLKNKDPQLALEKLQDLRAAYPYQVDITAQLGVAYAQTGDYDNALKYLNMAAALDPENAYVLYNQAVLFDKTGHSDKAGDLYRQIIRMVAEGTIKDPLPVEQIKKRLIDLR